MADYINSMVLEDGRDSRKSRNREKHHSGTPVSKWIAVSSCLLCILQVSLNISLRLIAYKFCDDCDQKALVTANLTMLDDAELRTCYNTLIKHRDKLLSRYLSWVKTPEGCTELADRYRAVIRDWEILEDKFNKLQQEKTAMEKDRDQPRRWPQGSCGHLPPL